MAATTTWRGITTDPETALYLTAVAAEVTRMAKAAGVPDFNVTPIPGCGSYQTTTAASAGTHAGGGAVDINAEGLTDAQARVLESAARKWGGTAWFRPRTSPTGFVYGWQRHVHILRTDCGDLAAAARTQVGQYRQGLNGLANNGPDTGDRSWVDVVWGAVKGLASTIGTIGAATVDAAKPAQEDGMAGVTPDDLKQIHDAVWFGASGAKLITNRRLGRGEWAETLLGSSEGRIQREVLAPALAPLQAQISALTAAVQALATSKGADANMVASVVDKAVRDRLSQVKFDVTDTAP